MKLISMTDFVLEQKRITGSETQLSKIVNKIFFYAEFLKQPLTLGMFVPCAADGNVLEDLQMCCNGSDCGCMGLPVNVSSIKEIDEYREAESRVLFNFNDVFDDIYIHQKSNTFVVEFNQGYGSFRYEYLEENSTVEDLVKYNLVLTESAKKQIGL